MLTMAIALLLTVPLYGIAIDWGRWIHISGLLFFITFFSLKGSSTPRRYSLVTVMLIVCLAVPYTFYWRIPHTVGEHKVFWWWTQDPAGYLEAWRLK
jgi:uncharacterized membrane protein